LYQDLRVKSGLVYYIFPTLTSGLTRSVYQFEFGCDPPNVSKARAIILSDIKDLQTEKVSPRELLQTKIGLLRDIPLAESSVDYIAQGWLRYSTLDLPLDEPVRAGRIWAKLDAKNVQEAFAKWIRPEDLVQVTQGPKP
jgi:zinc protease